MQHKTYTLQASDSHPLQQTVSSQVCSLHVTFSQTVGSKADSERVNVISSSVAGPQSIFNELL